METIMLTLDASGVRVIEELTEELLQLECSPDDKLAFLERVEISFFDFFDIEGLPALRTDELPCTLRRTESVERSSRRTSGRQF